MNNGKYIAYVIRVIFLTPFIFLSIRPYLLTPDVDIVVYMANYLNANMSFELGYEIINIICRDIFGLSFYHFWLVLLFLQIFLLGIVYKSFTELLIAVISLVSMHYWYGTQVRYAIFCLAFIVFLRFYRKRFVYFSTIGLHSGGAITSAILAAMIFLSRKFKTIYSNVTKINIFSIALICLLTLVSFFIEPMVNSILGYWDRFAYYVDSEVYMVQKSLVSILYMYISLTILLYAKSILSEYEIKKAKDTCMLINFSIFLLYFSILTMDMAALSGRMLILYLVIEPIIAAGLIIYKRTVYLGVAIVLMALVKLITTLVF
ncbi:EpsG family protein [Vibrio fluvialis]|nr:EpsG family protein [Vibrio fluvialis]